MRLLSHSEENIQDIIDHTYEAQECVDYRSTVESPVPMIYQSGYLTIKGHNREDEEYKLDFPNHEVASGFSSSTQYDDYFISEHTFHWQSQNTDSHTNTGGQRYLTQKEMQPQTQIFLFVRQDKRDNFGTSPYSCMWLVDLVSSHGDFPMNIESRQEHPAMSQFFKVV